MQTVCTTDGRDGPRLLDRVRLAIRARHYSLRTEEAYVAWIRRFILFHGKRHPVEMGEAEINAFLTYLAVSGGVSASTQNQALAAMLFLYATSSRSRCPGSTDDRAREAAAAAAGGADPRRGARA